MHVFAWLQWALDRHGFISFGAQGNGCCPSGIDKTFQRIVVWRGTQTSHTVDFRDDVESCVHSQATREVTDMSAWPRPVH